MIFNIGDKVKLTDSCVREYEENPDDGWSDDAHETFVYGRIFTITKVIGDCSVQLDDNVGGGWDVENVELAIEPVELDEELFKI